MTSCPMSRRPDGLVTVQPHLENASHRRDCCPFAAEEVFHPSSLTPRRFRALTSVGVPLLHDSAAAIHHPHWESAVHESQ